MTQPVALALTKLSRVEPTMVGTRAMVGTREKVALIFARYDTDHDGDRSS